MKHNQGEMKKTDLGAMRESNKGRGRFDLIPYEAMEALAIWYEKAADKYPERDWEKGISVKDCINRMLRHGLKASNGWTDEDHLAAVMWNAATAITMMKRRPDCNDHKWIDGCPNDKIEKNPHETIMDMDEWHKANPNLLSKEKPVENSSEIKPKWDMSKSIPLCKELESYFKTCLKEGFIHPTEKQLNEMKKFNINKDLLKGVHIGGPDINTHIDDLDPKDFNQSDDLLQKLEKEIRKGVNKSFGFPNDYCEGRR